MVAAAEQEECEKGHWYAVGHEKSNQVIKRLNRQGMISLMEVERLVSLLERKGKHSSVIKGLQIAAEADTREASLRDFKGVMEVAAYNRVTKGVIE